MPQQAAHPRAGRNPSLDRLADPETMNAHADVSDSTAVGARPDTGLEASLEPMLAAVVRLAGASAGTLKGFGPEGARFEAVVASGFPESGFSESIGPAGAGALTLWCGACAESRNAQSACVKSGLCGHEQRFPTDVLGPACKHVIAVPLRHRDRPLGVVYLLFEADCALPPGLTPLLHAAGELFGATLADARRARENLRICLSSERHLMANEVHDSLAQGLTYMRMRMSLLRDAIAGNDELRAHKFWNDVDDTLGHSQRRLRELITYFRSRMDPQGLLHALREISGRFHDRTGIALAFINRVPDLCLAPEREIEAFHIVQEALANVCRHANARNAQLILDRHGDQYEFVVEDDGVGIAADAHAGDPEQSGHYGLTIMRERAHRLGGNLVLGAAAAGGMRVQFTFPATADPAGAGA